MGKDGMDEEDKYLERPRSRWFMSDMQNFSFFRLKYYFRS